MRKLIVLGLLLGGVLLILPAQNASDSIPKKKYVTQSVEGEPPQIDGFLNDEAWEQLEWGTDFIQRRPYDNTPPTQETRFKILYDDQNLYVAFRCYDSAPDSIVRRMSRRDGFVGDWVEINIDSYHDLRSAFSFSSTVAGVKGDEFISNNGNNWDDSWNPIWFLKTQIDEEGWTAELRIPLSQLRYGSQEEQVWGIQITRRDFRNESRSVWQYLPNQAPYWVSGFGELHGIKGIKPQKQIELQPYVSAQVESFPAEAGNPFADGLDQSITAGLDGKIGITGDLVLDFTINPDFGQVEADPSAVNLDGFEVFFEERRPFFIENRNLFSYQLTSAEAGGSFNSDNLFYSRRIGGPPHRYPNLQTGEYADLPQNSTILGAAKFSGKTQKGLAIGILESVTQQEVARIEGGNGEREEVIEPLSSFFVSRLTQDFDGGNTVIGGIFTSTQRRLTDTGMEDRLHRSAISGSVDVLHKWDNQQWQVGGRLFFSHVAGTQAAILRTQRDFVHYFDRPDAEHLSVDSSATDLTGHGGTMHIAKYGNKWRFQTGLTWRSPELELNDVGFQLNADEVNHFFWGGMNIQEPFSIFRTFRLNYNHWHRWDFGGNPLYRAINTNAHVMLNNFWGGGGGITYENLDVSNRALFGGPAMRRPNGVGFFSYLYTDNRKKLSFNLNYNGGNGFRQSVKGRNYSLRINYQPWNAVSISLSPSYETFFRKYQHIATFHNAEQARYIGGSLSRQTFRLTARTSINFTPNLTLQYYGQPYITQGVYSDYKRIINPMAQYDDRFALLGNALINPSGSEQYFLDEDLDGMADCADCSFNQPDFNFIQFRSNLVLRWEYVPGSELYLVFSQANTQNGEPELGIGPSFNDYLVGEQGRNIFLLKWTYRFLK